MTTNETKPTIISLVDLTDIGGPSSIEITHHTLTTYPFTLIVPCGGYQNAEPIAIFGHLAPHAALVAFMEAYNKDVPA